jgi:hypothetical protein
MITIDGYSKDPNIMPEGIAITWGKDLVQAKGGLLVFIRFFERVMADEDGLWLQRCKNRPTMDIIYVYVIVCNQVRYRCTYGGHEVGGGEITNADGKVETISWQRIILAGPFVKAPVKIHRKGFQGFRYCTKLF